MRRFLQKQTISEAILQKNTIINGAFFSSIILLLMFLATPSFANTCYNVNHAGQIGTDQSTCKGESVTISNITLPSGGSGSLEYMWLFNTSGPYVNGASIELSNNSSYTISNPAHTVWVRRCARRSSCAAYSNSWDFGESNWVKITVSNAKFEHVDGINESACNANNGKIVTDPFIDQGTTLPYNVEYTFNGQVYTAGPFNSNEDHYITGLAPGVYSNITMIDANGCEDVHNSNITIHEYTNGCNTTTCNNVTHSGEIGVDQATCKGQSVTINSITLPSGGTGDLEYMWLFNTSGPYLNGASTDLSNNSSYTISNLTHTVWVRRCARRSSCAAYSNSWDFGESNWVKITLNNAVFQHVDGVNESSCNANDGKIITDPYVDLGTKLPYNVQYTYNGQVFTAGPFNSTGDNYITGLAPGIYSNITMIDATGCKDVYDSDITIGSPIGCQELDCGNAPQIDGMMYLGTLGNSLYYKKLSGDLTYNDAKAFVSSKGGHLVTINSAAENAFITSSLDGGAAWLGLNDAASEGNFQWITGESVSYTNWHPGEPNNSGGHEDYVEIMSSGVWNDVPSSFHRWVIMELPCSSCSGNIDEIVLTNGTESITLTDGGVYKLCDLPTDNYLEALVSGTHESFKFTVDGDDRTENALPYNYPAVSNGVTWNPQIGTHTIVGKLFSENGATGNVCDETEINITITSCEVINECQLNDYGYSSATSGGERLVWLNFDGSGVKEYAVQGNSNFVEYADGSALITGSVVQINNSNNIWNYSVRLINKRNWADWSALGRDYKSNTYVTGEDHTTWTYYELDNNNSTFTGAGALAGKTLHITHNPSNYEFGFQIGYGANVKDVDFGLSGWFAFTGSYTGHGDFNGDLECANGATIGDMVFNDINGNGIKEAGEDGIAGVTVMLLKANGDMVDQTQTDVDGKYSFVNVPEGDYKLKFPANGSALGATYVLTLPNQGTDEDLDSDAEVSLANPAEAMTAVFTVNEGDEITNIAAGYYFTSTIAGLAWQDLNANGVQDLNEPLLDGIVVMLLDENGDMVEQTTTINGGLYSFGNLAPGDYQVKFPEDANLANVAYTLTDANIGGDEDKDSDPVRLNDGSGNALTQIVSVADGATIGNLDAGYIPLGTIGDMVFNDINRNGIREAGEDGIAGVTVMLLKANGDMVDQIQTDADGKYTFVNVPEGDYKLKFPATGSALGATYVLTLPNQGTDEDLDSDAEVSLANPAEAMTALFTVTNGDVITNLDAGYFFTSTIAGVAWQDINLNGVKDASEPSLDDIVVMLLDENGDMVEQTTTTSGGLYSFDNLVPGDYQVKFPEDANLTNVAYTLTDANVGGDEDKDSDPVRLNDGSGDALTQTISVADGTTIDNLDAGYIPLATIGNFIFDDANGNGIQDLGEEGIEGVTVTLLHTGGFFIGMTTTDENGFYSFNVLPGDYKVNVSTNNVIDGITYTLTAANQGTNEALDSDATVVLGDSGNAETNTVSVTVGQLVDDLDIGFVKVTSIGNLVFEDANANGIQDNGETGLPNVAVFLLDENGSILDDTMTDEFGNYIFEGLTAGNYKVQVVNDVNSNGINYTLTNPNEGGDDNLDSDGTRSTLMLGNAMTEVFSIQAGKVIDNVDFGYIKSARIGDMAFKDNNADGIMNAGDEIFEGVTVELSGTDIFGNIVSRTTNTNSLGKYNFDNLTPGTYVLAFSSPITAFVPTVQDAMGNTAEEDDSDIDGTGRTAPFTVSLGSYNKTIDAGFQFDASLPVALTSFEAQLINNNQVILRWATASEENNRHFIVERSVDGTDFEPIGVVAGHGTTNTINHYTLEDRDPFFGNNYYRLKQVDFDGGYEYSSVETVLISGNDLPDVIVYPNPVVRTTTLRVVTPFEQDAIIEIVNQNGQVMQTQTILQGANSKQLDLSENAPGLYFAYINYNGHRTLVYTIVKVEE